jgi:hypothetical protein
MLPYSVFNSTQIAPNCEEVSARRDYIVRLAHEDDYPEIAALQMRHLVDNLSESERKDGFLSALMSREQMDAIAKDPGIAVAYRGVEVAGLCVSSHANGEPEYCYSYISSCQNPCATVFRLRLPSLRSKIRAPWPRYQSSAGHRLRSFYAKGGPTMRSFTICHRSGWTNRSQPS